MTEVRISSLCERPCAGIEETGEAPSDAGGMECSRRRKVHSLIDKVYDPANLAEAWKRVRENKGSAGIDGLTVAGFEQRQDELLERLHKQLREKTYRPSPVKRVAIPKLGGGTRNLGIPSVRDRVVQQALVQKMNPIFEELLRNVGDGRGQAASDCWLTVSMPSMNFTPVISFGNWLWPSRRRQLFSAACASLKTMAIAVLFERHPLERTVRCRTVANVLSMGLVVRRCFQCSAGKS